MKLGCARENCCVRSVNFVKKVPVQYVWSVKKCLFEQRHARRVYRMDHRSPRIPASVVRFFARAFVPVRAGLFFLGGEYGANRHMIFVAVLLVGS